MSKAAARRSADIVWNFSARHELPARAQTRENGWQHEEGAGDAHGAHERGGQVQARGRGVKKQPKPPAAAEKSEKPTSRRFRRAAFQRQQQRQEVQALRQLKDGSEDDWFAAWDVKNNVFVASARTAANVVYNTSSEISARRTTQVACKQTKKSRRTTASGGWDKVYTLPSASSSPSARCRRRREAALFEPRHSASGLSAA